MDKIFWNNNWQFVEECNNEFLFQKEYTGDIQMVRIPHTNVVTEFNYFGDEVYQMQMGYRKIFTPEQEWEGKHVLLTFEGAAHHAQVYLNGKLIGEHFSGYTAFQMDLAPHLRFGEENLLSVFLDSREDLNIPPFGKVVDYMTYGGIYRDVYIEVKEKYYIEDVFVVTTDVTKSLKQLKTEITLNSEVGPEYHIRQYMTNQFNEIIELGESNRISSNHILQWGVEDVELWNVDSPTLYTLVTELYENKTKVDEKKVRFGFREAIFKKDGFYLNGQKIKLRGLNRHQSYPYVGYAMPKSPQIRDADILKEELGLNAVRTSHYPQSQYFIDRCDEIGLLVFTEFPGWQHIGDEKWKEIACKNVEEMVLQYRNHPSIIIWGVRINESRDDDEFYTKTNEIAHSLDPSRSTGGVRCIKHSNLLEDVYTYNDFYHDGITKGAEAKKAVTSNMEKPYLISEYNGHMYPTKNFDCEGHRLEQAIRHATVLDEIHQHEDILGGFGWCMFDYNTHKDFGSGDRICYHGVMDMFRNSKLAASVYASYLSDRTILEISSSMDIGEHPGGCTKDIYAFTNADAVRVYKNDMFIKEFTHGDSNFKHIHNAPILIDDFIGNQLIENEEYSPEKSAEVKKLLAAVSKYGVNHLPLKNKLGAAKLMLFYGMKPEDVYDLYGKYIGNWGGEVTSYRFEAIKNNKVVKTVIKQPFHEIELSVDVDHTRLVEDHTYDVASIRLNAVDESGNQLYYYNEPISLETEGEIELIGPACISFKGGMTGTYVKTIGNAGDAALIIRGLNGKEYRISFTVELQK